MNGIFAIFWDVVLIFAIFWDIVLTFAIFWDIDLIFAIFWDIVLIFAIFWDIVLICPKKYFYLFYLFKGLLRSGMVSLIIIPWPSILQ